MKQGSLIELLQLLAGESVEKMLFKSKKEAAENLDEFLDKKRDFEVNDMIKLNAYGKHRHKDFPENIAIKCVEIFDKPTYDNNMYCDIAVGIVIAKHVSATLLTDSRYYDKAEVIDKNVVKFPWKRK